jgi:hypothetical protein
MSNITLSIMKIRPMIRVFVVLFVVAFTGMTLHLGGVFSSPPGWDAESGKHRQEVVGQTFNGVVLSMRDVRFNHTKHVLARLGINATQKVPHSFKSKEVDRSLEKFTGNRNYHTDLNLKVWSNRMAFIEVLEEFVLDTDAQYNSWRFFFEDDVELHPSLSDEEAQLVLARGMALANTDGIVFLGICGPSWGEIQGLNEHVQAAKCAGTCAHAFGFQQWKAAKFLSLMTTLNLEGGDPVVLGFYFDRYLHAFGRFVHQYWLLGSNLKSPVDSIWDHFGLLYQDRATFNSEISQ